MTPAVQLLRDRLVRTPDLSSVNALALAGSYALPIGQIQSEIDREQGFRAAKRRAGL